MPGNLQSDRLAQLLARQSDLTTKLARLEKGYDFETQIDEKLRLEQVIAQTKQELRLLNNDVFNLQQQINIAEADRLKRNGAYAEALALWQNLRSLDPNNPQVIQAITYLEYLCQQTDKVALIIKQISRLKEIRPIFKELSTLLKQPSDTASYHYLCEQVEFFLTGTASPDTEGFLLWWEEEYQPNQRKVEALDIARLAARIQRGEIVLFLGSGISDENNQEAGIATYLAEQIGYTPFNGTLSAIAEYYQLKADYGQSALLENLRARLPTDPQAILLYKALAQIAKPLVLISAAYDNLLAQAFDTANKPYVELTTVIQQREYLGKMLLRFSDKKYPSKAYTEDELSPLCLMENGYSIIYKIRGTFNPLDSESLILSERDYFEFARHAPRSIPDYFTKQLRNRGFLFIGYRPLHWEERLIASILLEKRQSPEPCHVLGSTPDPLESAYWESRHVKHYVVDLKALDNCLMESAV